MATNGLTAAARGTLKFVDISKIHWDKRFREDFSNLEGLIESIKEKGVLQPITLSTDLTLLAGERRIRASIEAGLTQIPALIRNSSDILDAREVELYENVFRADFTWSEKCSLVSEIDKLYKEKNLDWSGRKTAQLLNRGQSSVVRDLKLASAISVIPELAEYKTADEALKVLTGMEEQALIDELRSRQKGLVDHNVAGTGNLSKYKRGLADMLRIADANYRIGDVFKGLSELRTNGVIHIIECDPPYGIDLGEQKGSKDSVTSNVHTYEEVERKDYPAFLDKLTAELYRVAAPNAWLVFWFGPTWQHEVLTSLRKAQWLVDEIPAVWTKRQGQTLQPELYFARGYEPFYLCRKGKPYLAKRGRLNVFDFPATPSTQKYHPTERPLPMMQDILETLGVVSNIVLVPFLGSGVTLRAAYLSGMSGIGWDLNGEYKDKFLLKVESDTRELDQDDSAEE